MTARRRVHVRVPASSANLGPGYDSFGLALDRYDDVVAERTDRGLAITVTGVGAGQVPTDGRHLVARAAFRAFAAMGIDPPGLRLECVNRIPHGGGQGSSAAAIVAGIVLARELAPGGHGLSDDDVFALATEMEGHPDNVAPALYGGFTVAWMSTESAGPRIVRLTPDPRIHAMVFTADDSCSTSTARAVLPPTVAHADAAANSARAALLVHALTADPRLLFEATVDYLHQGFRASVMPRTAELLTRLRGAGVAAVLSGAGPSVLALGEQLPEPSEVPAPGFHAELLRIPTAGVLVDDVPLRTAR